MKKNLLTIMFASLLALSLGACGDGGNDGDVTSAPTITSTVTTSSNPSTSSPEAHTHTFASEWTSDETDHWHAATCGHNVVADKAAHSLDDHGFCSVCGAYAGRDFVATTENVPVNVAFTAEADKTAYVRIQVLPGRSYAFDYSDGAFDYFDTGSDCWYKNASTKAFVELYPSTNIDIPAVSDGYVYFKVVYAKAGSFTLTFKLKVQCDHSGGVDDWGFCLNEQCKEYTGHESGNYENQPVAISSISAGQKDYYAIYLFNEDVQHVFMMSGVAGGVASIGYMNGSNEMVSLANSVLSNGGQYYLPENFMAIAKNNMLYVSIHNQGSESLTGNMAVASIGMDGFDMVQGFKRFHGPEVIVGASEDIQPFIVYQYHVDEPTPSDTYYYSFVFASTIGKCYKLECDGFTAQSVMMYKMNGENKEMAVPVEGGFEANGTTMYGLISTDEAINENDSICVLEGHFPDEDDVYKGFYCKHHTNPIWMGDGTLVVNDDPINISLAAGEVKRYRFNVDNITHFYSVNPSDGSNLEFKLYYWNGSTMVEIEEESQWTYQVPQCSPVIYAEPGYYYLSIENTSTESQKDFTFYIGEEHNYNSFGVCYYDGSFRPTKSYEVSQDDVTSHNTLNFNLSVGDQKFFKVPMTQGHSFKLEFNDSLNPTLATNNQIKFAAMMNDDYDPIEISFDEVGSDYINATMPTGVANYLYVVVTPIGNPINSAGFKFYDNGHYYGYYGRCSCYDYEGITLAYDMPLTGQPALEDGGVLKFRFEIEESFTRYDIYFDDQVQQSDLTVVYFNDVGGAQAINDIDQTDTTFRITFSNFDNCDDGYIYILLTNSSGSSYVINGLSYTNHLA